MGSPLVVASKRKRNKMPIGITDILYMDGL